MQPVNHVKPQVVVSCRRASTCYIRCKHDTCNAVAVWFSRGSIDIHVQASKAEEAALKKKADLAKLREVALKEKTKIAARSQPASAAPRGQHQTAPAAAPPPGFNKGELKGKA